MAPKVGQRLQVRRQAGIVGAVDLAGLLEAPLGHQQAAELGAREPLALDADRLAGGRERELLAQVHLDLPLLTGGDRVAQVLGRVERTLLAIAADHPGSERRAEGQRKQRSDLALTAGQEHQREGQQLDGGPPRHGDSVAQLAGLGVLGTTGTSAGLSRLAAALATGRAATSLPTRALWSGF